jgi:hypothetical protein
MNIIIDKDLPDWLSPLIADPNWLNPEHPRCGICRQHHGPEFCWGASGGSAY